MKHDTIIKTVKDVLNEITIIKDTSSKTKSNPLFAAQNLVHLLAYNFTLDKDMYNGVEYKVEVSNMNTVWIYITCFDINGKCTGYQPIHWIDCNNLNRLQLICRLTKIITTMHTVY